MKLVAEGRIELPFDAYETSVLPLDDTAMEPLSGLEPDSHLYERCVLPVELWWQVVELRDGVEPSFHPYQGCVIAVIRHQRVGVVGARGFEPPCVKRPCTRNRWETTSRRTAKS